MDNSKIQVIIPKNTIVVRWFERMDKVQKELEEVDCIKEEQKWRSLHNTVDKLSWACTGYHMAIRDLQRKNPNVTFQEEE